MRPLFSVEKSRSILSELAGEESTGAKMSPEQASSYKAAIEGLPPPPPLLDVNGGWE